MMFICIHAQLDRVLSFESMRNECGEDDSTFISSILSLSYYKNTVIIVLIRCISFKHLVSLSDKLKKFRFSYKSSGTKLFVKDSRIEQSEVNIKE